MKRYAQQSEIPIVVFAQLWEEGEGRPDFGSRVQNDRNFVNHAHTVLEIIPDYELRITTIVCHKQRWGNRQNWHVDLEFNGGRLMPLVRGLKVAEG